KFIVTSRSTGGSTLLLLALITEARSCFGDETGYRSPKDDNCPIQTTFPFLMLNCTRACLLWAKSGHRQHGQLYIFLSFCCKRWWALMNLSAKRDDPPGTVAGTLLI